jgi:hypothetical protein
MYLMRKISEILVLAHISKRRRLESYMIRLDMVIHAYNPRRTGEMSI